MAENVVVRSFDHNNTCNIILEAKVHNVILNILILEYNYIRASLIYHFRVRCLLHCTCRQANHCDAVDFEAEMDISYSITGPLHRRNDMVAHPKMSRSTLSHRCNP